MITLLIVTTVLADPGRTLMGMTVGADLTPGFVVNANLDYGVSEKISLCGELFRVSNGDLGLGVGVQYSFVDNQWWRIGLTLSPGIHTDLDLTKFQLKTGLRADYLIFWGLTLTVKAEEIFFDTFNRTELTAGFSVRM